MDRMSEYECFCELLCVDESKLLDPSQFIHYLVSLCRVFTGSAQAISVPKMTGNWRRNQQPFAVTSIDSLIPCLARRDRTVVDVCRATTMTPPFCFAALPDQRLFVDGKDNPYLLSDQFRWHSVFASKVVPPTFNPVRSVAQRTQRVFAAGIISDGETVTHCVYGVANGGLYYNPQHSRHSKKEDTDVDAAVQILDENHKVMGIFRQHDHLYVVCEDPKLFEVTLTTKTKEVAVHEILPSRDYKGDDGRKKSTLSRAHQMRAWTSRAAHGQRRQREMVGAYYDEERGRLLIGTSNAR